MKRAIVWMGMLLIGTACFAKASAPRYLITRNGEINCKRISLGMEKAHVVLENGKRSVIPVDQIKSYHISGKQFDRLEYFENGKDTNTKIFMQLVKTRGNLSLYRLTRPDYLGTYLKDTYDTFYVYKNGVFYLQLNNKSLPNVFRFFRVKLVWA